MCNHASSRGASTGLAKTASGFNARARAANFDPAEYADIQPTAGQKARAAAENFVADAKHQAGKAVAAIKAKPVPAIAAGLAVAGAGAGAAYYKSQPQEQKAASEQDVLAAAREWFVKEAGWQQGPVRQGMAGMKDRAALLYGSARGTA